MNNTIWIFGLGYWAKILIAKINEQFKNSPIFIIDPNIKNLKTREISKFKSFNFSDIQVFREKSKKNLAKIWSRKNTKNRLFKEEQSFMS